MFTETFNNSQAWTAATAGPSAGWYLDIPDECLSSIADFLARHKASPVELTETRLNQSCITDCRKFIEPALDVLNTGRGFFLFNGVSQERFCDSEVQGIYWAIGQMLGNPFEQDLKRTLLYDVQDTGQAVTEGARFSVTNAASSFHTDNTMGKEVPDIVGLLCLRSAKSGGQSQLISACTIYNELLKSHRQELETLYQNFCFDRRGLFSEGESPVNRSPVFEWTGVELTARYLRYYIEAGHETVGEAMSAKQEAALDAVDSLLARPDLRVEFHLQPGEMLFVNNRRILHNRTAFEDHADVEQRRHCVRLWLSRARR